jgi:hypothetical protein
VAAVEMLFLPIHAYRPESTVADLVAAYAYGLAKNHTLVDGNKRAAFLSIAAVRVPLRLCNVSSDDIRRY